MVAPETERLPLKFDALSERTEGGAESQENETGFAQLGVCVVTKLHVKG
jgi:hypothetical protein